MPLYINTFNGRTRETDATLGYPWLLKADTERPPSFELAVKTADAILAEVGDDPALARAALDAENSREFPPRKVLSAKLQKIIEDAES